MFPTTTLHIVHRAADERAVVATVRDERAAVDVDAAAVEVFVDVDVDVVVVVDVVGVVAAVVVMSVSPPPVSQPRLPTEAAEGVSGADGEGTIPVVGDERLVALTSGPADLAGSVREATASETSSFDGGDLLELANPSPTVGGSERRRCRRRLGLTVGEM